MDGGQQHGAGGGVDVAVQQAKARREATGRNAPPLLREGDVLRERYQVTRMIGGGGFGQIFRAFDTANKEDVAIKVEPISNDPRRMILEQAVLTRLHGCPHIPRMLASGGLANGNYIVMQLLGKNMSELRRKQPTHKLSAGSVIRIGQQIVAALRQLHEIGFLHRDIKPSNMCIGASIAQWRTLYLVDFGMARQFTDATGSVRNPRPYAGFRGTMRYVSLRVHKREEQGPVDDMWGLFYTLVELVTGGLPWRSFKEGEDVYRSKRNTPIGELCQRTPALVHFADYLESLNFDSKLDYARLTGLLAIALPLNVTEDTPFDWEVDGRRPSHSLPASPTNEKPS